MCRCLSELTNFQVDVPVSVATLLTTRTSCTRTSVTDECALWVGAAAPRTDAAATAAATTEMAVGETTAMQTAPLPPHTEIAAAAGTEDAATAPAPTRTTITRTTTTTAPEAALGRGPVLWGKLYRRHQAPSLSWPSSSTLPSP